MRKCLTNYIMIKRILESREFCRRRFIYCLNPMLYERVTAPIEVRPAQGTLQSSENWRRPLRKEPRLKLSMKCQGDPSQFRADL